MPEIHLNNQTLFYRIFRNRSYLNFIYTKKLVSLFYLLCLAALFYFTFVNVLSTDKSSSHSEQPESVLQNTSSISSSSFKPNYLDQEASNGLVLTSPTPNETESITCKFPKVFPFDESILPFLKPPLPLNCTAIPGVKGSKVKYDLLFTTDYASNLIMLQDIKKFGFEACCYKNFSRTGETGTKYADFCTGITSRVTKILPEQEFIAVYCIQSSPTSREDNSTSTVPPTKNKMVDMFNFVPIKPNARKLIYNLTKANLERQMNVLVLGIDSVSHMHFLRTMPKTNEYLAKDLLSLRMDGYTKVGDNTFPNIVPALTGLTHVELSPICWDRSTNGHFDNCPFIWKNFSSEGYLTSYAEDAAILGIFNYAKRGFDEQPTDYYLRTLTQPMANEIGHIRYPTYLCYGPRSGFSVLMENIKKTAAAMGKDNPYFQFTWATSLFHDDLNLASLADEELRDTLKWLKDEGYLENTALIVMSDHGTRFGGIRNTFQGKVEERMPFLHYIFPDWFTTKYANAITNMKLNQKRLTSPFDFHETLKDLMLLGNVTNSVIAQRTRELVQLQNLGNIPRGISLFLPIFVNRTCNSAGIEQHYCVCNPMLPVARNDEQVQKASSTVIKELNKILKPYPQCSVLSLNKVSSAQVMNGQSSQGSTSGSMMYSITLSTLPGNATFEATVRFSGESEPSWTLAGDVSRTNLYGNQSACVAEYDLKKYCFCA